MSHPRAGHDTGDGDAAPPIRWLPRNAGYGAALAAPAAVATAWDPEVGLVLSVGLLCAAGMGLRGPRRQRLLTLVAGVIAAGSIFLGATVAPYPVVALVLLVVLGVLVAAASTRIRFGTLVLMLALPLFSAGLSESGAADGVAAAGIILLGSAYAWLVSLAWPDHPEEQPAAPRSALPRGATLDYGLRLGLTGALAVGIGYALGFDHPGWGGTAALMVSRPDPTLSRSRGIGRVLSVLAGGCAAFAVSALGVSDLVLALLTGAALLAMTATAGSRWYITAGFTTFVILTLLALDDPSTRSWWLSERTAATLIGVGIAYVLMYLVPTRRLSQPR